MNPAQKVLLLGKPFTPTRLFAGGEQGVWFDPSDLSTMFQDSAGTTPVTAAGQSVGKIIDKSGRGNHATQATSANRPVLQQDSTGRYYLAFNGTNSAIFTGSIDFTSTNKMTVVAGARKLTDASTGMMVELSANENTNNGSFWVLSGPPSATGPNWSTASRGDAAVNANQDATIAGYAAPITSVLAGAFDIAGSTNALYLNGTLQNTATGVQGNGNYGNYPVYVGARGGASVFFNGNLYGLIVRGAVSNQTQIAQSVKWMNGKTGAY